ncbi:MAG: hypothetical protein M1281_17530 [Chloroflexi bacterium]|nr:hypothetical protein [Chloroflexota bacterium]
MAFGAVLLSRVLEPPFFRYVSQWIGREPTGNTSLILKNIGMTSLILGILELLFSWQGIPRLPEWGRSISGINRDFENWLSRIFRNTIDFGVIEPVKTGSPDRGSRLNRVDALFAATFLLFAVFFYLARIQGDFPYVYLGSDAGNIASFAAAWNNPGAFHGDALLGNLDNIRIYSTIHIPLLNWLNGFTHNYSLAMTVMLIPHIFIMMLGFYIFGRVFLKNRYWAFLLAVVNTMPITITLAEAWGIIMDPVPRFTFQALLPYLLSLVWIWRFQPKKWPILMVFVGVLAYVHPVSTPAWMVAIWLSLWIFVPKDWSTRKKVGVMLGLGLTAVLVALPFAANYLRSHNQGSSADYSTIYNIIKTFFPRNLLNIPNAMADFGKNMARYGLYPACLAGLAIVWLLMRKERKSLRLMITWILGILLMAVAIPWIEQTVELYLRMLPLETELVRGIRYLIPFMLLFCLWPLSELYRRATKAWLSRSVLVLGTALVAVWVAMNPPYPAMLAKAASCFSSGKIVCQTPNDLSLVIDAIRQDTPPGATIFSSTAMRSEESYAIFVRYLSLRPLVFSYKDRGLLGYSNEKGLLSWYQVNILMDKLTKENDRQDKFDGMLSLAKELGAEYMLIDFQVNPQAYPMVGVNEVYQNNTYSLLKIN